MFCFFQELNTSFFYFQTVFLYSLCCYVYYLHAYKTEHFTRPVGYHKQTESQVFFLSRPQFCYVLLKKLALSELHVFRRTVAMHIALLKQVIMYYANSVRQFCFDWTP